MAALISQSYRSDSFCFLSSFFARRWVKLMCLIHDAILSVILLTCVTLTIKTIYRYKKVLESVGRQPPEVFCEKKMLLKISQISAFRPATLLKRDSNTDVFLWNLRIFMKTYFEEYHLQATASQCSSKKCL